MAEAAPTEAPAPEQSEPEQNGNAGGEQPQEQPEQSAPPAPAMPPVVLRNRYYIHPDIPLSDLSTPSAVAYEVQDNNEPERYLFALACKPGLPPRTNVARTLKGNFPKGLMPIAEWDTVWWPPLNRTIMVIIYERPRGGRLTSVLAEAGPISEYDLPRRVIQPLTAAMQELNALGFTHRAIRVSNMYFMDEDREDLVLGDCVSTPPGYDQPVLYETIERGMSMPGGRGPGTAKEDLYAIGVSLVIILLGYDPFVKRTDAEIIDDKIVNGSYTSICGKERVPLHLLEAFRGFLSDDVEERWGVEELDLWVNGRQMTPIQRKNPDKSDSSLKFGGKGHITKGTLAHALFEKPGEGARFIKSGDLGNWIKRAIGDSELAGAIQTAIDVGTAHQGSPKGSDEFLVAKVAMLLQPEGPIRYKSKAVMAEGFGPALAVDYTQKGGVQELAELINEDIFAIWRSAQPEYGADVSQLEKNFAQLKIIINNQNIGYGVERCLYELNPSLPCLSPLVQSQYVARIEELLPVMEDIASEASHHSKPIDRHLAAFIAARFRQDVEPHLNAVSSPDEDKNVIGMLSLMAAVQWRLNVRDLKGLTSWFGGLLGPVIGSYHSRTVREELEKEIPGVIRHGDLAELFALVDNPEARQKDVNEFAIARMQFKKAEDEIAEIESSDISESESAQKVGQQTASMASILLTMVAIVIFFMMEAY